MLRFNAIPWLILFGLPGWVNATDDIYAKIDHAVVCVEGLLSDDKQIANMGSGFFIQPHIIATSLHQVASATNIIVYRPKKSTMAAKLVASDPIHDVALLYVDQPSENYLPIQPVNKTLGDSVFTIGCILDTSHSLTKGVISQPNRLLEGMELIQIDLAVNYGNSGGPLVNQNGEILGIIHGFMPGPYRGINFATPVRFVSQLMLKNGIDKHSATDQYTQLSWLWKQALSAKDPRAQVAFYNEILEITPSLVDAAYNKGIVYHKMEQYELAIQSYDTAIKNKPEFFQAHTNRGLALYRIGQHVQARSSLLRALHYKDDYGPALFNLGLVYSQGLSNPKAAKSVFEQFLRLNPDADEAPQIRQWLSDLRSTDPSPNINAHEKIMR